MDDMISRQAAIDAIQNSHDYANGWLDYACEVIERLPSAQPETTHRVVGGTYDSKTRYYKCAECGEPVDINDNYCSGCGRRFE